VLKARLIQNKRYSLNEGIHANAQLTPSLQEEHCRIDQVGETLLRNAMQKFGLSARTYSRIFKVARTIADLEESAGIKGAHIAEAIQYRSLDRMGWQN